LGLLLLQALTSACSHSPKLESVTLPSLNTEQEACLQLYQTINHSAQSQQVVDPVYQRLPGADFLRTDRFLASFAAELHSPQQYQDWLLALNRNAREALVIEWQRLGKKPALANVSGLAQLQAELYRCGQLLVAALTSSHTPQPHKQQLLEASQTASLYRSWSQPLAKLMAPSLRKAVSKELGHRHLQERQEYGRGNPIFDGGLKNHHIYGSAKRFPEQAVRDIVAQIPRDSLGLPRLSQTLQQQLLDLYSPYWALNSGAKNDIPGALEVSMYGPQVNTNKLSQYRYSSYSRWQGEVVLQLNYVVWFSRRRAEQGLDLLAGELDGLLWRVYLKADGNVLAYDAMHNCGCWYQLFINPRYAQPKRQNPKDEPAYVSKFWPGATPPLLLLEANSHQLIRPVRTAEWGLYKLSKLALEPLQQRNYTELRSRPIFNQQGVINKSKRLERLLLWPTGVPNPGAMRVRNKHIIAFVGERYFDQPDLLQSLVQKKQSD